MIFKQFDKLDNLEVALLNTTRNLIASLETDRPKVSAGQKDYSDSHFGAKTSRLVSGVRQMLNFESKGYLISKFDDDNFTASSASFPNQWKRIFVTSESVTFIYRNGGLLMKPRKCLMANEQQVVKEVRNLVKKGDLLKQDSRRKEKQQKKKIKSSGLQNVRLYLKEKAFNLFQ